MASILEMLTGMVSPQQTPMPMDVSTPPFAPQQSSGVLNQAKEPGILESLGIKTDNFGSRLGNALIAGGSRNPGAVLSDLQKTDAELRAAGRPKMVQIPGTPFFMTSGPDGRQQIVDSQGNPIRPGADGTDPLKQYMMEAEQRKNDFGINKILTSAQAGVDASGAKGAQKTAEETRPILNDVTGLKDRWIEAQNIIKDQGTWSQIQAIPGIQGISGFLGGDDVAKNKFLEGLTVDETLLNTARTKGAISNQEMNLFKSPIPSTTDDREKVWKPWIEKRLEVLNKLEKYYQGEIERGTNPQVGGGNKPKMSGGVTQVTSEAEWQALPAGTVYKDPNGVIRTKK